MKTALRLGFVAAGALAASVVFVQAGCVSCWDNGCGGGFLWRGHTEGQQPLPAGTYGFRIVLEGSVYAAECDIAETLVDSECSRAELVEGDEFFVRAGRIQLEEGDWKPDSPVGGFTVSAEQHVEHRYGPSVRGPTEVGIQITYEDHTLLSVDHDVEYERDHDVHGDPRCGYCDEKQERSDVLPLP
jgi:hypothetical protein